MAATTSRVRPARRPRALTRLAPWLLVALAGCAADGWKLRAPWAKAGDAPPADAGPTDTLVLRGGALQPDAAAGPTNPDLEAARRLFQNKEYAAAEAKFHQVARKAHSSVLDTLDLINGAARTYKSTSDPVVEEGLFYEAECQRLQKNYRDAVDTYTKLITNFHYSQYKERINRGLFEIADHWLVDTRRQMDEYQEKVDGKRWFVTPASFVHTGRDRPLMDTEGHAVRVLEMIRLNDINGTLGERALFYLATVKFFRRDYHEADHYFTQLYQQHPNSEFAPKAIKQAVICKQLCTGGTEYDLRTVEESKKLLHIAQTAYPELSKEEQWIGKQLVGINLQQADRDWKIAEFYRRTGHPGSAYFYYELVERRYARTPYATKAAERKQELQAQVAKERAAPGGAPAQLPADAPARPADLPPLMRQPMAPNLGQPEDSSAPPAPR